MNPSVSGQLGLGLQLRDELSFSSFYPGPNALVLASLQSALDTPGHQRLFLHGPAGSGRSHLLQAACLACRAKAGSSILLPLQELTAQPPAAVLNGLENLDLIALDNLNAVCGHAGWEEALFHALNRWQERYCRVLISADQPPGQLPIALADLRSRLNATTVFQLRTLDDADKTALLQQRALARGLQLDAETARFLIHRLSRGTAQLMDWLDRLDRAALAQQRRLTIPFVRSVLGTHENTQAFRSEK